ncbi:MAG: MBL fold metallo-hydrolase [Rhodospirillales bacterium]|nr:MBL fold metallo-hydrolase [Rhodospirillales bacterium]
MEKLRDDIPQRGEVSEIVPGVYWLRMPLPFVLNHINLWLLADGDGWTLVDTGLNTDEIKSLWRQLFATALDGRPITRLIVTHFHPDHAGLAGWLTEEWGVDLWMSQNEWLHARMLSMDTGPEMTALIADFYRRAGCSGELLAQLEARGNTYASRVVPIPRAYRRIRDGMGFDIGGHHWRVLVGRGHAPEHVCLHCAELDTIIAGDQILPKISPVVGVYFSEPEAEPLSDFLATIANLQNLPASTRVLPSHGIPFVGVSERLSQLASHHEARLEHLLAGCTGQHTAAELAKVLFPQELDLHQTQFALGETLAHLHHLMHRGQVRRQSRADGVHLYAAA